MPETQNLIEVTVEIAHYVRAHDSFKIEVTPEQAAELEAAFEEGEEPSGALVDHIFQNGQLTGTIYVGADKPEYDIDYYEK